MIEWGSFRRLLTFALLSLAVTLTACASDEVGNKSDIIKYMSRPKSAVARVGNETISALQLEEESQSALKSVDQQIYDIRRRKLEELIEQKLWALEAKNRGISVEELKASIGTDSSRVGRTGQEDAFLAQLERKYPVRLNLDPPRYSVSIEDSPTQGPSNAPVTFIEWTDFECPFCSRVQPTIRQIREIYPNLIRYSFKHFPLPFHRNALTAHNASLCAEEQGKFWEYRNRLFKFQRRLDRGSLIDHARELGLDADQFEACVDQEKYHDRVLQDLEEAMNFGVTGTPTFFINGRKLSGAQPLPAFQRIIDEELSRNL